MNESERKRLDDILSEFNRQLLQLKDDNVAYKKRVVELEKDALQTNRLVNRLSTTTTKLNSKIVLLKEKLASVESMTRYANKK